MPECSSQTRRVLVIFEPLSSSDILEIKCKNSRVLYVSDDSTEVLAKNNPSFQVATICFNRTSKYLGQELDYVIFDARFSFDANAFAAICGSIVGGGKLVLILDKTRQTTQTKAKPADSHVIAESQTIIRLIRALKQTSHSFKETTTAIRFQTSAFKEYVFEEKTQSIFREQQHTVDKIKRCATGHSRRPLIITANRGRGKSASIGIAVAQLLLQKDIIIGITAPTKAHITVVQKHLERGLAQQYLSEIEINESISRLIYVPPDEAMNHKNRFKLMIVEEAGSLPVQVLNGLCNYNNRIVFSTTIDGYEGSGQGFELRFKPFLLEKYPQLKESKLHTPIRWIKNDPLELSINKALILTSEILPTVIPNECFVNEVNYELLSKDILLNNEPLLVKVYSLLISAHYQTRPNDLERMLSNKDYCVFVASYNDLVVATALVSVEGNLTNEDCKLIDLRKKSFKGHLLPQSLISHRGIVEAGEHSFWRIMRVAVNPYCRRHGIATGLIKFIENKALQKQIHFVGASYALSRESIEFWYSLKYQAIRIGLRKDSSTGLNTGEFLKLLANKHPQAQNVFQRSVTYFNESFLYNASSCFQPMDSSTLALFLQNQDCIVKKLTSVTKNTLMLADCNRFILKARSFEMVEWSLFQLVCEQFRKQNQHINFEEKTLVFAKLIQRFSWDQLEANFDFLGKKQSRESVRLVINKLLQAQQVD